MRGAEPCWLARGGTGGSDREPGCGRRVVTREEFLDLLAPLRRTSVGNVRAPHKPLLLLWLFGRLTATGSTVVAYTEAEEPVSTLINDFGPPVAKASAGRQRASRRPGGVCGLPGSPRRCCAPR